MPSHSPAGVSSDEFGDSRTAHNAASPSLPDICAQVHERLETFLASEPRNERLRSVQEQSRLSLRIIEEALERYR